MLFGGPVYTPGKIAVTLSVGPDPTKSIQTKVKAATVTFKAINNTPPGTPTLVSYGATTQILSIGSNDQASENVLSSSTPATIIIGGAVVTPSVPVPSVEPSPTVPVTTSPTVIPSLIPSPSSTPSGNISPVCSNLAVDRTPSGDAPLSLTFTANGTDADGTVSKVTFNFGDGQVTDVADSGGTGTASVSAQSSHTYSNAGTFTALAILTDNGAGVSDSGSCQQTVTVTASGGATIIPVAPTAVPTLVPTGSASLAIGIGAAIVAFIVAGGFLFFLL